MKPESLFLRCYAERDHDGTWFGICLDLNLYARADSLADVKAKLDAIVHEYVVDALNDEKYAEDLLRRRAPLQFWVRYWITLVLSKLHQAARPEWFSLTLPVVPAHR